VHVHGWSDDTHAECYGVQVIPEVAEWLGRTPAEGRYLADLYWLRLYSNDPPPYWSPDCRNGGPLDIRPHSDIWP
jgi:hypothetical protein